MSRWNTESISPGERFQRYCRPAEDCIEWTGGRFANGYGQFTEGTIAGRQRKWAAHRYAWTQSHGPIPAGMFVCHRCDNPRCVRLEHLFLSDHQGNMDDKKAKGRQVRFVGESNQSAKLTAGQVVAIRARRKAGEPIAALASEYGVSENAVYLAATGKRWSHVPS